MDYILELDYLLDFQQINMIDYFIESFDIRLNESDEEGTEDKKKNLLIRVIDGIKGAISNLFNRFMTFIKSRNKSIEVKKAEIKNNSGSSSDNDKEETKADSKEEEKEDKNAIKIICMDEQKVDKLMDIQRVCLVSLDYARSKITFLKDKVDPEQFKKEYKLITNFKEAGIDDESVNSSSFRTAIEIENNISASTTIDKKLNFIDRVSRTEDKLIKDIQNNEKEFQNMLDEYKRDIANSKPNSDIITYINNKIDLVKICISSLKFLIQIATIFNDCVSQDLNSISAAKTKIK